MADVNSNSRRVMVVVVADAIVSRERRGRRGKMSFSEGDDVGALGGRAIKEGSELFVLVSRQ